MDWLQIIVLLIISSLAFYGLGSLLGFRKFFTSILVGLSLSGLLVAILANVSAGLMKPVILFVTLAGIMLFLRQVKGIRLVGKSYQLYGLLLSIGLVLLTLNFPSRVFIKDNQFFYNIHYPYFSNQSTEMLNARYYDRLRVADFFSYEWSRYHFFNSGVQASLAGLITHPGLFSYLFAQIIIAIYIILALIENLLESFGFNYKTALAVLLWLVIGLTFFGASLVWNLATTGPLSVFAIVMLLITLHRKNYHASLIFALILGASAFRLLPIGLVVAGWLAYQLLRNRQRFNLPIVIFGMLFLIYNAVTIFTGEPTGGDSLKSLVTFSPQTAFDDGWASGLAFYKTIGMASQVFLNSNFFQEANYNSVMAKVIDFPVSRLFLILMIGLVAAGVAMSLRKLSKTTLSVLVVLASMVAITITSLPQATQKLLLVSLPYGLVSVALLLIIWRRKDQKYYLDDLNVITILVVIAGFLMQFSLISFAVKIPVLLITYDILIWGLLGLCLISFYKKSWVLTTSTVLVIATLFVYEFPVTNMMMIKPTTLVDVSPLISRSLVRSDFADSKTNLCIFPSTNPTQDNLYQAIFGCRLDREPDEIKTGSLASRFVSNKKTK